MGNVNSYQNVIANQPIGHDIVTLKYEIKKNSYNIKIHQEISKLKWEITMEVLQSSKHLQNKEKKI